jgi:hypothetical protein
VVRNGAIPSLAYKRCIEHFGWYYQKTVHTLRENTWIDPETGDACHDILGDLGSSRGNF